MISKKHVCLFIILLVCVILYKGEAIDNTSPVTVKTYYGPLYEKDGIEWISNSTVIWLNSTDDNSGVRYLHYEIWEDINNDGVIDIIIENRTINDNAPGDMNNQTKKISVMIGINRECLHKLEFYAVDWAGNVEKHGFYLIKEWNYTLAFNVVHAPNGCVFGSSPAIANLSGDGKLEIVCGSDEITNFYPEINATARGIWRCFNYNGSILWALDTRTDESRSSPAIYDIDGDGKLDVVGGTTSGWLLEAINFNGTFKWTFPHVTGNATGGNYVWHSSPAIGELNESVGGLEIVIGNNPFKNVWCFDGDNSDGIDEGFSLPLNGDGTSPYFPGYPNHIGYEGIDWDVIWVFNTSGNIISTPAIDDVDNDGKNEIVFGSADGKVYILNREGLQEWNFTTGGAVYSSPAIADIDGDGYKEILIGSTDGKLYCLQWNGITGLQEWNFTTGGAVYSSPAIGDINADGFYEIVFGSTDGKLYCLSRNGIMLWNFTTGGAIYSSPALASISGGVLEWPMFRGNEKRTGLYSGVGGKLDIFVASEDKYIYEIDCNGKLVDKFLTNGRIRTSPAVADVDMDGLLNILLYDWGRENASNDTFWCLERGVKNVNIIRVDVIPPVTNKTVLSDDVYNITKETDIWLNATDAGNCSSGVNYLYYEIWHDSNWDGIVDSMVKNVTVYDNTPYDKNPNFGEIAVLFNLTNGGINEIRWFSVDNVQNREAQHTQKHNVIVGMPLLTITKQDSNDPVTPGSYLNYTINVTNTGSENATNVIVTETYDSNVIFISSNPSPSSGNNVWNLGTLSVGETKTISIRVQVKTPLANGTILHNYVNVTCLQGVKAEAWENTTVTAPSLLITKEGTPEFVEAGANISYRIRIKNNGLVSATNLIVKEVYDSRVTLVYAFPMPSSGFDTWTIPVLVPSASYEILVRVKVASNVSSGSIIVNYVNVTCDENVYGEAYAYTPVVSEPPYTYKRFNGSVVNISSVGNYVVHYILSNTTIDLVAIDNGSGVNKTFYRIFKFENGWKLLFDWREYTGSYPYKPINLAELGILYGYSPCGKYEIEFYSIDNVGNVEQIRWNDVFVDCFIPSSIIEPIPYLTYSLLIQIKVNATDIGVGIGKVALYYRYSPDNISWTEWMLYGEKTNNFTWTFNANQTGYYQFYSVAYDLLGNHEALPNSDTIPKAYCKVYRPWDVNSDGRVNAEDILFVLAHWMQTPSHPQWDERADVTKDGIVDVDDIIEIIKHWTG
ncbi:MAG: PQQ-binding-like beta-propeller repeat protein [Thermoplasmatales archaeon]|nr:PQQ-binding-like beta-propeller repeat protein [Thermoplasmatales archaeon]